MYVSSHLCMHRCTYVCVGLLAQYLNPPLPPPPPTSILPLLLSLLAPLRPRLSQPFLRSLPPLYSVSRVFVARGAQHSDLPILSSASTRTLQSKSTIAIKMHRSVFLFFLVPVLFVGLPSAAPTFDGGVPLPAHRPPPLSPNASSAADCMFE